MNRLALLPLVSLLLAPQAEVKPALGGGFGTAAPTPPPNRSAGLAATPAPAPAAPTPAPVATKAAPSATPVPTARPAARATPTPAATPPPTAAPTAVPQADQPQKAKAVVSVGYVMVPFVVTDSKGRPVANLKKEDVSLLVDGAPVDYDLFEKSEDAPVSFTILLDGSGSMGLVGKMEGAKAALRALLAERIPGDDFSLHVFSDGEVREVVPFTEDVARIQGVVEAVKPWGKTAFYDALATMPDKSREGKNGSRAIVLLSDGLDNASKVTKEQLAGLMEGIEVPVFPLGVRSAGSPVQTGPGVNPEHVLNVDLLGHIARISGGRMGVVDDPQKLEPAVLEIERDLRSQYLIGFTPTGKGAVRYRALGLKLAGRARPVRVRAGYRGTEPPIRAAGKPGS